MGKNGGSVGVWMDELEKGRDGRIDQFVQLLVSSRMIPSIKRPIAHPMGRTLAVGLIVSARCS